ncbi:MAG: hypothetical protein LQ350_007741 [Teloschistes chrysophthalmus]|nr:MAG: hypothetical protein LQ350_007741 [Niorma chrysophthalma]
MGTPSDHQCIDAEVKTKTSYLPPEIKQIVAEHSTKFVLKILRYVSREWKLVATPFLFDRVYISAYEMDFQVFNHITQTPSLANSVKEVICDLSAVGRINYDTYLIRLQAEIKTIARPDQSRAFHSSNRRLNQFVNDFTHDERALGKLKSQYAQRLVESYRIWRELSNQAHLTALFPSFDDALCAGFQRLPRLEAVKLDNGIWERHRRATSIASVHGNPPSQMQPYDILGVAESGSPLARSWNPWHLRPKRLDYIGVNWIPWPLTTILKALVKTKTGLKRFDFWEPDIACMTVDMFSTNEITDATPQQMAIAFAKLEHLDLQITPHVTDFPDLNPTRALGFLPDLLDSMHDLKSLSLRLESDERIHHRQSGEKGVLEDQCLTYSQVFPSDGLFAELEYFHLGGLTVDGVDLLVLLCGQMPRSKHLSFGRIDLVGETRDAVADNWDAVVEVLRQVGGWEAISLEGPFRHKDHEWWPPTTSNEEEGDRSKLGSYIHYITKGGRRPRIAPEVEEEEEEEEEVQRSVGRAAAIVKKMISIRQFMRS